MTTIGELKIGTVFRKWDGSVCKLLEKSSARAIIAPGRKEVSLGTEIIEVLQESLFKDEEEEPETKPKEKEKSMSFYVYLKDNYSDGEIVAAPNFAAAKFCFSKSRKVDRSKIAAEKRRD